jgi:hypothetical protein
MIQHFDRDMKPKIYRLIDVLLALPLLGLFPDARTAGAETLLEAGGSTVWKFLDTGAEPDERWRQPQFDDSKWTAGHAPLGYGDSRLRTLLRYGPDPAHKRITTWIRGQFDAAEIKPDDQIILSVCVDDGAVIYLNGNELSRVNMPAGRVTASTLAAHAIGDPDEGLYLRLLVPPTAVRPKQPNTLAIELHQASVTSSDLFFDVEVKVRHARGLTAEFPETAAQVTNAYYQNHYVGPGSIIPDGYLDGGRHMVVGSDRRAASEREILRVDRSRDEVLAGLLAFARSPAIREMPILDRVRQIAVRIDKETTPPGGPFCAERTVEQLEREFKNQPVLIGDFINEARAGVCRHRALLFKILADEAGLSVALVRGNYAQQGSAIEGHAWNELFFDDGRRVIVDVSLEGNELRFLEVNTPEVIEHYVKVDNTRWYGKKAD